MESVPPGQFVQSERSTDVYLPGMQVVQPSVPIGATEPVAQVTQLVDRFHPRCQCHMTLATQPDTMLVECAYILNTLISSEQDLQRSRAIWLKSPLKIKIALESSSEVERNQFINQLEMYRPEPLCRKLMQPRQNTFPLDKLCNRRKLG